MKALLKTSAAAILLVLTSGVCFALWDVLQVSKNQAKDLGIEIRSTASGPKHVSVTLEFATDGKLKSFTDIFLKMGERDNYTLSTALREDRSKPGRVSASFTVANSQLDKLTLQVLQPYRDGALGGAIHELRVKDFVEAKEND